MTRHSDTRRYTPSDSPALRAQSEDDYPPQWNGRVPLRVRLTRTVNAEIPLHGDAVRSADALGVYDAWVNSYGAVAAILSDGTCLGLKPSDFVVVDWHPYASPQFDPSVPGEFLAYRRHARRPHTRNMEEEPLQLGWIGPERGGLTLDEAVRRAHGMLREQLHSV